MIDEKKLVKDICNTACKVYEFETDELLDAFTYELLDAFMLGLNVKQICVMDLIANQPKVGEWIPVEKGLPVEHDSIFAKFKGTHLWKEAMFAKKSDEVNVTFQYEDGTTKSSTSYTIDGVWKIEKERKTFGLKVIAWMPLPKPYRK